MNPSHQKEFRHEDTVPAGSVVEFFRFLRKHEA